MKLVKRIGLAILVVVGLVFPLGQVTAQHATDSVLAESIQAGRMTVLGINAEAGRIYCLEADGRLRVVEFQAGALPMIVANGVQRADLRLLSSGDLIKVYRGADGRAQTIVVLRRASDEISSPEQ